MRFLVVLVAALAMMTGWSGAKSAEARITDFAFSCETPEGRRLKPKFGDVEGVFYTDIPAQRQPCIEAVKRKMALCRENTDFASNTRNERYAECLPIFREQAQACVGHFQRELVKCDGGGRESTGAPPLEPLGPNWIVAENQPCQIHNASPTPGETITWSGPCVNGKASGEGRKVWRGSHGESVYEGGMRDGRNHGHGTYTWASGDRYEGGWRNGQFHGHGTYTGASGLRYEGEWSNGKPHGYGIATFPNGPPYEGEWSDGCPNSSDVPCLRKT